MRRVEPDVVPMRHRVLSRAVLAAFTAGPLVALAWAARLAWGHGLRWHDLAILAVGYVLTALGVTVGFHRLLTHRSFKTTRPLRVLFAVLGSMAAEMPVTDWVATHRKHHRCSDGEGDPHSPHDEHATSWRGTLRGLGHAHLGWLFRGKDRANPRRYAKDLLADPDMRLVARLFPLWVLAGLAIPFVVGLALTGSLAGGLTAFVWGGAVRIMLLHHATFSINSLCHFFGRRPFRTDDESRNLAWLAPLTMGEAWHNNHHAFPTSARHGLGRRQVDPSAWLIGFLERRGLAWDVVRIAPERQATKRSAAGG